MHRIFLLLLLSGCRSFAQGNAFTFYSVNEGLCQSTVTDIYKDPKGLLWVTTGDGLSVWNGQSFRNFKYRYNDPQSISNNRARHILPDTLHHSVWIGTESGLDRFNDGGTRVLDHIVFTEWAGNDHVPLLVNDTALWTFITGKGIYRVNTVTKKYTLLRADQLVIYSFMLPGTTICCYVNDSSEYVSFDLLSGKTSVRPTGYPRRHFWLGGVIPWNDGFLFATSKGLWQSDRSGESLQRVPFRNEFFNGEESYITAIARDSLERIWFAVGMTGLFSCDANLAHVRPQCWQQTGESVAGRLREVRKIICDAFNVLWISTNGDGVTRYNGNRLFFGETLTETPVTDSAHWFIRGFYPEKGSVWVATHEAGIAHVDYESGTIVQYRSPLFRSANSLWKSVDGSLLTGTDNGFYELRNGQFIPFTISPAYEGLIFHALLPLRDGRIIAGSNQCLYSVNEKSRSLARVNDSHGNFSGMIELADGRIVCAAEYWGLQVYDQQLQLLRTLRYDSLGLPLATMISQFVQDGNGDLWAASNIGLLRLNVKLQLQEVITDKMGLPDNMLYGILLLPSGDFCITTGKGMCTWSPASHASECYFTSDGLRSNECNTRAVALSPDGYLYVGGINGFVRKAYPFEARRQWRPVCFAEDMSVNDQPADFASLKDLPYDRNSIAFYLRLSDFAFSETGKWRYHLSGPDSHAIGLPFGQQFRFSPLAPGDYQLQVFLPGESREIFSLAFVIHPPWWQETWFRVLAIVVLLLLAVGIVYAVITYKYKMRLRRLETLRQVENVRARISSDIHDDLGAGLTRIALTSDLVSMQLVSDETLSKKTAHLAETARGLSQSLKEVVWSVKPEHDNLVSMVRYFREYSSEFFEPTNIAFTFRADEGLSAVPVAPETRRNLFLILKEALNNVIRHSGAANAGVTLSMKDGLLRMEIHDDGKGISATGDAINSSGLVNMRKRAGWSGFEWKLESNGGKGTRIVVSGRLNGPDNGRNGSTTFV